MRVFRARLAAVLLSAAAVMIGVAGLATPASAAVGQANAHFSNWSSINIGTVSAGSTALAYDDLVGPGRTAVAAGFYVGPGWCVRVWHRLSTGYQDRGVVGIGQHLAGDNGWYRLDAWRC
jgi:hypothetical protein